MRIYTTVVVVVMAIAGVEGAIWGHSVMSHPMVLGPLTTVFTIVMVA